jgi:hypothetical protein
MLGIKDARAWNRAQRKADPEPKRCVVCGRWFTRRRGTTCSKECAEQAKSDSD